MAEADNNAKRDVKADERYEHARELDNAVRRLNALITTGYARGVFTEVRLGFHPFSGVQLPRLDARSFSMMPMHVTAPDPEENK